MRPLDPIEARMFPRLASFARRQWWLGALGIVVVLCALSFAGGVMLGSYQGQVSRENYHAVVLRINSLEQFTKEHHPKSLRTTKAHAIAIIGNGERP